MQEGSVHWKSLVYEQLARIGKALSSPQRLELLDLMCQSPHTVENLAKEIRSTVANTSRHLQVLRESRLITSRKDGKFVYYSLADESVCYFFLALRDLGRGRLAELREVAQQFFSGKEGIEPLDKEELIARMRQGQVTVLDVRSIEEYLTGHIAGAISIPLDMLIERLAEIPTDQVVVAYCRGPYCVLAIEAVEILKQHGFQALRLDLGVPDWSARGYEVIRGIASS